MYKKRGKEEGGGDGKKWFCNNWQKRNPRPLPIQLLNKFMT